MHPRLWFSHGLGSLFEQLQHLLKRWSLGGVRIPALLDDVLDNLQQETNTTRTGSKDVQSLSSILTYAQRDQICAHV